MKKKLQMLCYIVSAVFVLVFVMKSVIDYTQYTPNFDSAPFCAWLLVNAVYTLIPAAVVWMIGMAVKKRPETAKSV